MSRVRTWISDRIEDVRDLDWVGRTVFAVAAVLALFVVAVIIAQAYNARGVTGTVADKDFTPAHTVQVTRCAITANGGCAMVVVPEYRPDRWDITVAPDDGSSDVVRTVPEAQWQQINIGDRWTDHAEDATR